MKKFITFLFLTSLTYSISQIAGIPEKKKCNDKQTARKGQRFADWDCGKSSNVVDCNEKLDLDENTNTVFSKGTGSPFTGTCETCHNNGILERKVSFVGGKENGTDTSYYETGCPMVIRTHIQGAENGQWTFFHDTIYSVVAWEMNFFAGEKHGKHVYFTKKGDTTLLEHYQNGLLDGVKKKYYPYSKIKSEINYKKGLMNGYFINYNYDGVVIEKLNYKEGKKDGECTYFYTNGKLLQTENWKMDIKDGEQKTFYLQGHVQTLETYKKGIKEGQFEEYFPNQKIKREAVYKKDVLVEEHIFDEFGNETKTFGGSTKKKSEDDKLPGAKKKRKWFWNRK